MDFYFTIKTNDYAEYKERGSKFLAYSYSIKSPEEFRMQLKKLKKEHPKAVHHTFAYRIGYDNNNFCTTPLYSVNNEVRKKSFLSSS